MNNKDDLYDRIKKMNIKECYEYYSSAKGTNNIIQLLGITMCFMIVSVPNILLALGGSLIIYILAKLSTGIDETVRQLEERIVTLEHTE